MSSRQSQMSLNPKTLIFPRTLLNLKSHSNKCHVVVILYFLHHSNWTQTSLKSYSTESIFGSQNRLDRKILSNQFFAITTPKQKKHSNHTRHIFLLKIWFNFLFLQKQSKSFKPHSGAYQKPLDVCGRPFAPPHGWPYDIKHY